MRKTLVLVIVTLVVASIFSSCRKHVLPTGGSPPAPEPEPEPKIEETQPAILTPVSMYISANIRGYYQAVPARYNETDYQYPLLVHFHGGGQYGNGAGDLSEVLTDGIPAMLNKKTFPPSFTVNNVKHSFIVIAPQFLRMPSNLDIDSLMIHIEKKFRIDPKRIYLTGFSLGGRMLSNYAAFKPNKIAAITAMGGLPPINDMLQERCQALTAARLPIWQFHNRDDAAWPYDEAVEYIRVLNSMKPAIKPLFTTFDVGEGKSQHDCWTRTTKVNYRENGKNIYEWMLSYTR